MVVNFRVNHAPLVLTRETREMQENGTPAKCSLCYCSNRKGLQAAAPFSASHRRMRRPPLINADCFPPDVPALLPEQNDMIHHPGYGPSGSQPAAGCRGCRKSRGGKSCGAVQPAAARCSLLITLIDLKLERTCAACYTNLRRAAAYWP